MMQKLRSPSLARAFVLAASVLGTLAAAEGDRAPAATEGEKASEEIPNVVLLTRMTQSLLAGDKEIAQLGLAYDYTARTVTTDDRVKYMDRWAEWIKESRKLGKIPDAEAERRLKSTRQARTRAQERVGWSAKVGRVMFLPAGVREHSEWKFLHSPKTDFVTVAYERSRCKGGETLKLQGEVEGSVDTKIPPESVPLLKGPRGQIGTGMDQWTLCLFCPWLSRSPWKPQLDNRLPTPGDDLPVSRIVRPEPWRDRLLLTASSRGFGAHLYTVYDLRSKEPFLPLRIERGVCGGSLKRPQKFMPSEKVQVEGAWHKLTEKVWLPARVRRELYSTIILPDATRPETEWDSEPIVEIIVEISIENPRVLRGPQKLPEWKWPAGTVVSDGSRVFTVKETPDHSSDNAETPRVP